MTKKKLMFVFYVLFILIALSLLLIFKFYRNKEDDELTYATSLNLNCARTISMPINTSLELINGFLTVSPNEASKNLNLEITPKTGSPADGLVENNGIFLAKKVGYYNVVFSVPKSINKFLTEMIIINVTEENRSINMNLTTLKIQEEINIDELFTINSNADLLINVDSDMLLCNGNSLIPICKGETSIELSLVSNYIKLNQSYSLTILSEDFYTIKIDNLVVEDGVCSVEYRVLKNNDYSPCQDINIEIENPAVQIISISSPIILLNSLSPCKSKVTLSLLGEEEVSVSFYIVFSA